MLVSRKIRATLVGGILLASPLGCSSTTSLFSSNSWGGWFGSGASASAAATQGNLAKRATVPPSTSGAVAKLGEGPPQPSRFASLTSVFKSSSTAPAAGPSDDPLRLDTKPKQVGSSFYVQMARMHEAQGNFDAAIKQYEQSLAVSPNDPDVLVAMARAYDRKNDYQQALAVYQRAVKASPNNAIVHNDLGLCLARHRDMSGAAASLQRAVELAPTSTLYRNNYATVLVELNRNEEALRQLTEAHSPAAAHYNLGFMLHRQGNAVGAQDHFQQAVQLDPNLVSARKMVDRLSGVLAEATPNAADDFAPPAELTKQSEITTPIESQPAPVAPGYADAWDAAEPSPDEATSGAESTDIDGGFKDEVPLLLPPAGE